MKHTTPHEIERIEICVEHASTCNRRIAKYHRDLTCNGDPVAVCAVRIIRQQHGKPADIARVLHLAARELNNVACNMMDLVNRKHANH